MNKVFAKMLKSAATRHASLSTEVSTKGDAVVEKVPAYSRFVRGQSAIKSRHHLRRRVSHHRGSRRVSFCQVCLSHVHLPWVVALADVWRWLTSAKPNISGNRRRAQMSAHLLAALILHCHTSQPSPMPSKPHSELLALAKSVAVVSRVLGTLQAQT